MKSTCPKTEFREQLLGFINGPLAEHRGLRLDQTPANYQTKLFEQGWIDSLGIIDLIAFIERKNGSPIPPRMIDMKNFGSVNQIADAFWVGQQLEP
jgi:acyl carrier protein